MPGVRGHIVGARLATGFIDFHARICVLEVVWVYRPTLVLNEVLVIVEVAHHTL